MTLSHLYLLKVSQGLKFKVLNGSVRENAPNTYEILLLHRNIIKGLAKKEKCNLLYHHFFVILSFFAILPLLRPNSACTVEKNGITQQSEMLLSISHSQPFP